MTPKHKLYRLLRSFKPAELKDFAQQIPARPAILQPLVDHLLLFAPEFSGPELRPPALRRAVPGANQYPVRYVTDQLSRLARLAEDYLIRNYLHQHAGQRLHILNQVLLDRSRDTLQSINQRRFLELYENTDFPHWEGNFRLHRFYHTTYGHPRTRSIFQRPDMVDMSVRNMHYLDRYYLITKLVLFTDQRLAERFHEETYAYPMLKQVLIWARLEAEHDPIVRLHLRMYNLQTDRSNPHDTIPRTLQEYQDVYKFLSVDERQYAYYLIKSVISGLLKSGQYAFDSYQFQLYAFVTDKGLLETLPQLMVVAFLDAVNCATTTGHLEWAENFIRRYENRLHPDFRELVIDIARSDIDLRISRPQEILNRLYGKTSNHPTLRREIYSFTIRAAYLAYARGLQPERMIYSRIDTTARGVKFDKWNYTNQDTYRKLVKVIRIMVRHWRDYRLGKNPGREKTAAHIRALGPNVAAARWVNEQIEALP